MHRPARCSHVIQLPQVWEMKCRVLPHTHTKKPPQKLPPPTASLIWDIPTATTPHATNQKAPHLISNGCASANAGEKCIQIITY